MYLSDALRSHSGGHIEESAGPGGPTILRLRGGEEVFTQTLLDGVQLNQNGGFFDFQGLMLTNVARIEVLRGPQSALYGSTAMSGVVQKIGRASCRERGWVVVVGGGVKRNEISREIAV